MRLLTRQEFINTHKLQIYKYTLTNEITRDEYKPPAITIQELDLAGDDFWGHDCQYKNKNAEIRLEL